MQSVDNRRLIDQRQTTRTKARYDRQANTYDFSSSIMDRLGAAVWRRKLWAQAQGPGVLEIGVGTGASFPYYSADIPITAIDLSPRLLERARRRAAETMKLARRRMHLG